MTVNICGCQKSKYVFIITRDLINQPLRIDCKIHEGLK